MPVQSRENEQGLRSMTDLTRAFSILLLSIHFYYFCGVAFASWGITTRFSDRILVNIAKTGLFHQFNSIKWMALGLLLISLAWAKSKTAQKPALSAALWITGLGFACYFGSYDLIQLNGPATSLAILYISTTVVGYVLILAGGTRLSLLLSSRFNENEFFNRANETFPQEERFLENDFSINLPAEYQLRGKIRKSWVNLINPRRGLLVMGSPGSGKSWFIIENIIRQQIEKGFTLFIYDFKYPDLTTLAWNHYLGHQAGYSPKTRFFSLNFSDLDHSHRCNPLYPGMMTDILDAMEASKTMLLSINRTWAARQGEFFVESPINFLAAVIWFLRKYQNGKYCTLPHAIELLQLDYDKLFTVLNSEPEVQVLVAPFLSAYLSHVMETLESQIASVRIPMGRLSSPQLYYLLSGNDFFLDINNPGSPKIVCLGNDPVKSEALAPVISLICDRMNKIINQKGKMKCSTVYDEFGTIRVSSVITLLMTGRSNDIVVTMGLQDFSMLKRVYSREEAETIFNATGNVIFGQVGGETAKLAAERFSKVFQPRESISIHRSEVSINKSRWLDQSVPSATIAGLSSGEFVGMTADNPDSPLELKAFHCKLINDEKRILEDRRQYKKFPRVRSLQDGDILSHFSQIKKDVQDIFYAVFENLSKDPEKTHLIVRK